ncbi:MAG TPA: hypothetical protein ACHBY4_06695 [Arsenophonus apicola]|jgi:hypothetical protein|uniref:hypothetical protein n=2 Tax=Morganellaceae TaxID=1903414 RepID=UPI0015D84CC7|nr:hypothetical protein [Arsenophonus endosymbiont of Apis mellifera]
MKSILLIMPFFNGYEKEIKRVIESFGFKVKIVRDSSFLVNLLHIKFFSKRLYNFYMDKIWPFIFIQCAKGKYDYLFVIKGEELTPNICQKLYHYSNFHASILYLWDSIANIPKAIKILPFFDYKFTFDYLDYNSDLYDIDFLPLFYSTKFEYKKEYILTNNIDYDFSFIGSFKQERADILLALTELCNKKGYSYYFKLYLPWNEYLRKIFTSPGFYKKYNNLIIIKKFSLLKVADIVKKSRVIVDVPDKMQSGLTMRTFEALGARKKLFTTNHQILKYHFYNENNITIDINKINENFVFTDFEEIKEAGTIRDIYSWIGYLLSKLTDNKK